MQFARYQLDFRRPFESARSSYIKRWGLILVQEGYGETAFGEVAPLPGFSKETLGKAVSQINRHLNNLQNFFKDTGDEDDWIRFADSLDLYPSVRFGLDTVFYDRLSKLEGTPLNTHFSPDTAISVQLNYTVAAGQTIEDLLDAWNDGYRCFKIKAGINFEREKAFLYEIRDRLPAAKLRIDVNQAWDLQSAIENLKELEPLGLEYCEQPLPAGNLDDLKKLKSSVKTPIAADEAVRSFSDARNLIENHAADVLILKPALIGSYGDISRIAGAAKAEKIPVIFTTSLESGVGRLATAHIASCLGSGEFAHGIATGGYFTKDILDDHEFIKAGCYLIPDKPGLGAFPDLIDLNFSDKPE